MLTKNCIVCGKEFIKPYSCGMPEWNARRKFCSHACHSASMNGKRISIGTEFRKGHKAENPIRKGEHRGASTEFKKGVPMPIEIRNKLKGRSVWNKGMPFIKVRGKNHWNWKGGKTKLQRQVRTMLEYLEWRKSVLQRDGFKCVACGRGGNVLIAHHIKPFCEIVIEHGINTMDDARKCDELWKMENGQTLCIPCHKQTDSFKFNQWNIKFNQARREGRT